MVDYKLIGSRVKQVRLKKGLTQERLSELSNISSKYVSVLEGGHKKPSIETLVRISNSLGVSVDYLLADSLSVSSETRVKEVISIVRNLNDNEMDTVIDVLNALVLNFHKGGSNNRQC